MWQAKHAESCEDQTKFLVLYQRAATVDAEGNVLDAEKPDGRPEHAECNNCCAPAHWVEPTK